MIRKTDALLAPLSAALGHAPPATTPAPPPTTRQLCKVPTTQSEATGAQGGVTDTAAMPAQEAGRKRKRSDDMQALVAQAAEAAAAAEAVVEAAGDEDDEDAGRAEEAVVQDPKEDSEHKMRATHAALDMWRTLVTNAKTPTSFPKDDPVRSFGASS